MKLFCMPYAGGSAISYRGLGQTIGEIQVVPLELPGHGKRIREALLDNVEHMAEDLFAQLQLSPRQSYAFFGHSLGACLAWVLTKRVIAAGLRPPEYLFVTGRRAPSVIIDENRHSLPQAEFVAALKELGGCPPEVLADAELMEFFEPILRADFHAIETYEYIDSSPIDVPILVMIGEEDDISTEDAQRWQTETTRPIVFERFPGNHFFIFDHWSEIRQRIRQALTGNAALADRGNIPSPAEVRSSLRH